MVVLQRRTVDTLESEMGCAPEEDGLSRLGQRGREPQCPIRGHYSGVLSHHFVMARSKCRENALILKCIYYRIIRPVWETDQTTSPVQNETVKTWNERNTTGGAEVCTDGLGRPI